MLKVLSLSKTLSSKCSKLSLSLWPTVLWPNLKSNLKSNLALSIFLSLLLSFSFLLNFSFVASAQQTSTDLFPMVNGTQVQILSSNFLTVITSGQIIDGRLELYAKLTPTQDVQLLFSNAQTGEVSILPAIVSFKGDDLLIPITGDLTEATNIGNTSPQSSMESYISLRNWLLSTNGITLTTASGNP